MFEVYVRYEANPWSNEVKVILVHPSPYGDNLDKEMLLEVLK